MILRIQGGYKLSRDFAKPYFHKYWNEIYDVTTIWKRNVCSFIVTFNAFDVRPMCDMADVQAILPFPPFGKDFAKPYFHKYWTEIIDVTTIWKRNVCSFIVTLNAFDVTRHMSRRYSHLAGMGVSPGHLPCHTLGAHRMHLGSLWNCKHSSFKW